MSIKAHKKPPLVLVVAAILVNPRGRILLAKRPQGKAMAGLWEFPGGKARAGEDLKTALARELSEELGIFVDPEHLIESLTIRHDYPDFRLEMPVFLARVWRGAPAPMEGQELAWVRPEDLGDYPMPPADQPLIDKIPTLLKKF